jgi:hypothetical protein
MFGCGFLYRGTWECGVSCRGHARWLWPPIVVDKSISARILLARGSTFGVSVVIWRSRKRLFFYVAADNVLVAHYIPKLLPTWLLATALARLHVRNLARIGILEPRSTREKRAGRSGETQETPCVSLARETGNSSSAATLPQRERKSSEDVHRGNANITGFICTVASWPFRRAPSKSFGCWP